MPEYEPAQTYQDVDYGFPKWSDKELRPSKTYSMGLPMTREEQTSIRSAAAICKIPIVRFVRTYLALMFSELADGSWKTRFQIEED